jgi:hypothetical protein
MKVKSDVITSTEENVTPITKEPACSKFVQEALNTLRLSYDYGSNSFFSKNKRYNFEDLSDYLLIKGENQHGASKARLDACLRTWIKTEENLEKLRLLSSESLTQLDLKNGSAELKKWVDAVCDDGHDFSYEIMRHWIWNVKRKMLGLTPQNIICPVLYGRTQGGKTTEVRQLLKPLCGLSTTMQLDQLTDERQWALLNRFYVVFIDELAGGSKTEVEKLKAMITSDKLQQRLMRTTTHQEIQMQASFIGTSNKPVSESIKDPTSGARFWEIRCKDKLDWSVLNSLNHALIWQCVDPTAPSSLDGDPLEKIRKLQHEKIRTKPSFEVWLDETNTAPGDTFTLTEALYQSYEQWCRASNLETFNKIWFSKQLKHFAFTAAKQNNKRGWLVK